MVRSFSCIILTSLIVVWTVACVVVDSVVDLNEGLTSNVFCLTILVVTFSVVFGVTCSVADIVVDVFSCVVTGVSSVTNGVDGSSLDVLEVHSAIVDVGFVVVVVNGFLVVVVTVNSKLVVKGFLVVVDSKVVVVGF